MLRQLLLLALIPACRIVNTPDLPDPPDFRIIIEPDTVSVWRDLRQRSVVEMLVRTINDGPGDLFMPDCGHELHRAAPNGTWTRVHVVGCQTAAQPFHVQPGGGFGYVIRVVAPPDSTPWRQGTIDGRYRVVNYITTEFRPAGAWGRPVSLALRTSPEFVVREAVP